MFDRSHCQPCAITLVTAHSSSHALTTHNPTTQRRCSPPHTGAVHAALARLPPHQAARATWEGPHLLDPTPPHQSLVVQLQQGPLFCCPLVPTACCGVLQLTQRNVVKPRGGKHHHQQQHLCSVLASFSSPFSPFPTNLLCSQGVEHSAELCRRTRCFGQMGRRLFHRAVLFLVGLCNAWRDGLAAGSVGTRARGAASWGDCLGAIA